MVLGCDQKMYQFAWVVYWCKKPHKHEQKSAKLDPLIMTNKKCINTVPTTAPPAVFKGVENTRRKLSSQKPVIFSEIKLLYRKQIDY